MMTPADRRAVRVLAILVVAGIGVRWFGADNTAPGAVAWTIAAGARPERDSVQTRAARINRPLGPEDRIDLNRADASALGRLPGIGPGLAGRIIRDREANGDFAGLDDLVRVAGVGTRLASRLEAHAAFSSTGRRPVRGLDPAANGTGSRVRINRATAAELATLPGIGPARARAIVAFREQYGPLKSIEDLDGVRGIGSGIIDRLRGRVEVP